jgi:AcrR family transcriptional regulator
MPSPDLLVATDADPRSAEILHRIRETFVEKGFDGASMQTLAKSAGMSAGNFYRYFPSKAAIIGALIARDLQSVQDDFAAVIRSDDPLTALRNLIVRRISSDDHAHDSRLWAEIEAAAGRDSDIGQLGMQMQAEVAALLMQIFAKIANTSPQQAQERFGHHAAAMMILVKGASIHACRPSQDVDVRELDALIMRLVDTLLSEVADSEVGHPNPMKVHS